MTRTGDPVESKRADFVYHLVIFFASISPNADIQKISKKVRIIFVGLRDNMINKIPLLESTGSPVLVM